MTSRLQQLAFKIFGRHGATTASNPNSWAYVVLWRRFFELKELQDEEERRVFEEDLFADAFNEDENELEPIASEEAVQARKEMIRIRETYKDTSSSSSSPFASTTSSPFASSPTSTSTTSLPTPPTPSSIPSSLEGFQYDSNNNNLRNLSGQMNFGIPVGNDSYIYRAQ